jgi:hypothetical protein
LGGTALVTAVAWGAYEWASGTGYGTIGMIAGIVLVPAGIALAGLLAVTLTVLARRGVRFLSARRRARRSGGPRGGSAGTRPAEGVGRLGAPRDHVAL